MAANVTLNYKSHLSVIEELDLDSASAANSRIKHERWNTSKAFNAGSDPAAQLVAAFEQALTAGAATIDLTGLAGTNGATVDGTGKKVIAAKFSNPVANSSPITIGEGAANGYELAGDGWSVTLGPGDEVTLLRHGHAPAIGATAKDIDLSGTGTETLNVILVLGSPAT